MLKNSLKIITAWILSRLYNLTFDKSDVNITQSRFDSAFSAIQNLGQEQIIADKPWKHFDNEIKTKVLDRPRYWFFNIKIIRETMTGLRPFAKYTELDNKLENYILAKTLSIPCVDDAIGGPVPNLTSQNKTSVERKIHYYQACLIVKNMEPQNKHIIEWGGGYGGLASIIMRHDSTVTYTIIDLPNVLRLQYLYLCAVLSPSKVQFINQLSEARSGFVNLLNNDLDKYEDVECDYFVSNWAISETNIAQQEAILSRKFFQAKTVTIMHQPNSELHPWATFIADKLGQSTEFSCNYQHFPSIPSQSIVIAKKTNG